MPLSDNTYYTFGGIRAAKEFITMDFYGRTTIDWKLECESQKGLDRKSIMDLMNFSVGQDDDKNNYYIYASYMVGMIMIAVFGCMCTCGIAFTGPILHGNSNQGWGLYVPYVCNILCTGAGACAVFGCLRWANDFMDIKEKKLISYTRFAACSSEYLTITQQAYVDFELAVGMIRSASWMAVSVIILDCLIICCACGFLFTQR